MRGIFPTQRLVTRKIFSFDYIIMLFQILLMVQWTRDQRYTTSPLNQDFELDLGPFSWICLRGSHFLAISPTCLVYILHRMWFKRPIKSVNVMNFRRENGEIEWKRHMKFSIYITVLVKSYQFDVVENSLLLNLHGKGAQQLRPSTFPLAMRYEYHSFSNVNS